MYVNVNNGERLNFGETAKTSTRRRFSGVILFLYHHDNLYIHARREDFSLGLAGGGGGGGPSPNDRKKADLLHLFCKSSIHFAEGVHFKENHYSTITFQYFMEEGGKTL